MISLTDAQLDGLMSNSDFRNALAKSMSVEAHKSLAKRFGSMVGEKFPIPISVATRLSGFSDKWIRRNLPLITGEGVTTQIEFGKIVEAMEDRETKLKKS